MQCWSREPSTSKTISSSIFITAGTIYHARSGLNASYERELCSSLSKAVSRCALPTKLTLRSKSMTPQQIWLVQSSFKSVAPIASKAADLFYDHLFVIAPEVRQLFPAKLSAQKIKLMAMLTKTVNNLHQLDAILPAVRQLAERHRGYGVSADHYGPVGAALLWTLEQGL